ncbi:hypothetical protein ACJRO7_024813 [Eucalyptus globulus]|uniref:EF-hand domain-containing protein n=1 Tax=Eucalyptus globulus TaxID=34317 RepID=A0ABD3K770_EUCGL
MEDIRLATSIFFEQNSQLKNIAQTEFSNLTRTKQGLVTMKAFDEHLRQRQPECLSSNLAAELDANNDGYLTFEDFLVYRYLFQTRPVCRHCKAIVKLVFYTCLECFAGKLKERTYDLCPMCYLGNKFSHPHKQFTNNYAVVNNIRKPPKDVPMVGKVAMAVGVGVSANALGTEVIDAFLPGAGN